MENLKFNGILKQISEQYPNIQIVDFLQENLQIPLFKAEQLAARIEKKYCQNSTDKIHQNLCSRMFEMPEKVRIIPKANVYSVESLSDKEFEHFILWLFKELGYEIKSEKCSSISGIDFIAIQNGKKIVVQARKFPETFKITDSIVLFTRDAKSLHDSERIIFLATTYFSEQAIVDAQKYGIELWDRDTLNKKISEVRKKVSKTEKHACFPQFNGSLLKSLLGLDETEDFIVELRAGGKFDLY
jgi:HJR/Mrr/RecB family endonuclease